MKSTSLFFSLFGASLLVSQTNNTILNSPLSVLGTIKEKTLLEEEVKVFDIDWVKDLKLILPCENIPVPKRTMRLPNAPRNYRNGIHRGIDFFANWGTPIRAVAEGVVIRSDLHYEEVSPSFRESVLNSSARVGKTPSDIFNSILLGQSVFLDHGFNLIPGFRVISIYAHLSHINSDIKPIYDFDKDVLDIQDLKITKDNIKTSTGFDYEIESDLNKKDFI